MGRPMGISMGRPMRRPMGTPMGRPMGRAMGIHMGRPMGPPMAEVPWDVPQYFPWDGSMGDKMHCSQNDVFHVAHAIRNTLRKYVIRKNTYPYRYVNT